MGRREGLRVSFEELPDPKPDPNPGTTERVVPEELARCLTKWGRVLRGAWHEWSAPIPSCLCPLAWMLRGAPPTWRNLVQQAELRFGRRYVVGFLCGFDGIVSPPDVRDARFVEGLADGAACLEWARGAGRLVEIPET